jgi:hypothetical protein
MVAEPMRSTCRAVTVSFPDSYARSDFAAESVLLGRPATHAGPAEKFREKGEKWSASKFTAQITAM